MPLDAGTRLGQYEIVEPVGKGGMGEVYRARDTKLDRDVAIKVLPEELAIDPERVARFEREAKVLASLNHPNIAGIYGFESSALVLELVEGPTLAERIAQGPLPVDEAIAIAKQIAEALEAGHDAGIVHRDLKPANIKVKDDGTVKVLDYGLAKALEGDVPVGTDSELSQSPTLTRQGTQVGVILGTAAYMSPEQAKGKRVDKRTDIWAFGAVLYEMLTGERAFKGDDVSETLASVIKSDPDWGALPDDTPDVVRHLLMRCLTKNPRERLRDIGDARYELQRASFDEDPEPVEPAEASRPKRWPALTLTAGFVAGVVAATIGYSTRRNEPRPARMSAELLSPHPISRNRSPVAITGDGQRIVFAVIDGAQLFQRKLDEREAVAIPGTEGATDPTISPDGEWIAFYASGQIKKVPIEGGAPQVLVDAPTMVGMTWATDDTIIFTPRPLEGLFRISSNGGAPERITSPDRERGELAHNRPSTLLPDGRHLLASVWYGGERSDAALVDLETGAVQTLLEHIQKPRFADTGHLLFSRTDGIYGVRFDAVARKIQGPEVPLIRDAFVSEFGSARFAIADDGTLVYLPGRAPVRELVMVGRNGVPTPLTTPKRLYDWPRYSPDGGRIAVSLREGATNDVWIVEPDAGTLTRLTQQEHVMHTSAWTPDGKNLVYTSDRAGAGRWQVYSKAADGSGEAEMRLDALLVPGGFIDATTVVGSYVANETGGGSGMRAADLSGTGGATDLFPVEAGIERYNPVASPDGRWLAYVSNESGRREVYITPVPSSGEKRLVSRSGGSRVAWVGDEIFFVSGSTMMVAPVEGRDARLSEPEPLFSVEPYSSGPSYILPNWDVSPDGQRFIMTRFVDDPETAPKRHLNIITNFFDELREKLPAGR